MKAAARRNAKFKGCRQAMISTILSGCADSSRASDATLAPTNAESEVNQERAPVSRREHKRKPVGLADASVSATDVRRRRGRRFASCR